MLKGQKIGERPQRERDELIWAEVRAGGTLKAVGSKYGVSNERARQITARVSRERGIKDWRYLGPPGKRRAGGLV